MANLEEVAKRIEKLRAEILFDDEEVYEIAAKSDVLAEQHYLAALAQLELAQRSMMLAHYHSVQALAAARMRR